MLKLVSFIGSSKERTSIFRYKSKVDFKSKGAEVSSVKLETINPDTGVKY